MIEVFVSNFGLAVRFVFPTLKEAVEFAKEHENARVYANRIKVFDTRKESE